MYEGLHGVALDTHRDIPHTRARHSSSPVEPKTRTLPQRGRTPPAKESITHTSPTGIGPRIRPNTTSYSGIPRRTFLRFATFNVRTLRSHIQKENLAVTLKHRHIDICAIQEHRMSGEAETRIGEYTLLTGDADSRGVGGCGIAIHSRLAPSVTSIHPISNRLFYISIKQGNHRSWFIATHAPTESSEDSDKDIFYDQLHSVLRAIPTSDQLVIGIDANGKLGEDARESPSVGQWFYRSQETSDNGYRLLELAETHDLILSGTWNRPKARHQLLTWTGSSTLSDQEKQLRGMRTLRAQLDHVLIRGRERNTIQKVVSHPHTIFDSDHRPVVATIVCKHSPRRHIQPRPPRRDFSKVKDPTVYSHLQQAISSRMSAGTDKDEESWTASIRAAICEAIPESRPEKKYHSVSDKARRLYNLMCGVRRQGMEEEAKKLRRALRRQLQHEKEQLWIRRAEEFEEAWTNGNSRAAYSLLRRYSGKCRRSAMAVKDETGTIVTGEAAKGVWRKHFDVLLNQPPPTTPLPPLPSKSVYNMDTSPPTLEELKSVIGRLKTGKAPGDDGIPSEILKALPSCALRDLHRHITSMFTEEAIPDSWRNAVIVPIHKKGPTSDAANYRGISLIRTTYKLLERLIVNRLLPSREDTARDEQAGFRPGRGTVDQVFTLRRILEVHREHGQPVHVAFLDFRAAFDSPDRDRLFQVTEADGMPPSFCRLLRNLYTRTTATVRSPAGETEQFLVRTGVRQGSVSGPILFNYVMDDILGHVCKAIPPEVELYPSGRKITDLCYADDIVVLSHTPHHLQAVCTMIEQRAAAHGLQLRPDKCRQMCINAAVTEGVKIGGQPIKVDDDFCYLGSTIQSSGTLEHEIGSRIAKTKSSFNSLGQVLWNTKIAPAIKLRVYLSAIRPILMYSTETLPLSDNALERFDVAERRHLRRLLGISYPEVVSNQELYRRVDAVHRKMTRGRDPAYPRTSSAILKSRLRFLGHMLRRPSHRLISHALHATAPPHWKKRRGAPRKQWNEVVKAQLERMGMRSASVPRAHPWRQMWSSPIWMDVVGGIATDRDTWKEFVRGECTAAEALRRCAR